MIRHNHELMHNQLIRNNMRLVYVIEFHVSMKDFRLGKSLFHSSSVRYNNPHKSFDIFTSQ